MAGLVSRLFTAQNRPSERRGVNLSLAELNRMMDAAIAGMPTATGREVSADSAMTMTAVWACVRILSETVASLPLVLYRRLPNGGKERAPDHPLYPVLHDRPNPEMTSMEFREALMGHLALWGNAFAEIQRQPATGDVLALWPLRPDRMKIERGPDGRLVYVYRLTEGKDKIFERSLILHLRGLSPNGIQGYSPLDVAREAIGLGLAAEEFGARFFGNGAVPGLVLQHPGVLGDDAHKRLRMSWEDRHSGLENAQRVAILEEGMTVEKIGIPPEDAQFLETRKFQVQEVARIFGVPLHMIADLDRATFSNIEQQSIDFVTRTVRPWTGRIEQRMGASLIAAVEQERYFVEHVLEGLLRGDIASRYAAYSIGRQWGWLSANDVRTIENMNPVEGLDQYLMPLNMVDATDPEAGQPANSEPTANEDSDETSATRAEQRALPSYEKRAAARQQLAKTFRPALRDSAQRVVNREVNDVGNQVNRMKSGGSVETFTSWLQEFYAEHEKFIARYMLATVATYANLVTAQVEEEIGGKVDADASDRFVNAYNADRSRQWAQRNRVVIEKSLNEENPIESVESTLAHLRETFADDWAMEETTRLAGAVAKTAYGLLGVTKLRWVAFGENCPHCKSLNGLVIDIQYNFLDAGGVTQPGDGSAPIRMTHNVGHPPLHAGCDCAVVSA